MDTPLFGVVWIVGSMVLSVAGFLVVRRYADVSRLRRQHDVANSYFSIIGTLYAVLIAFAVYVVWSGFKEASANLQHEATEIADLSRLSTAMPDADRRNITLALMEYLNAVVQDEFPAMVEGRSSDRTWAAAQRLWDAYGSFQPQTPQMQAYLAESLTHLTRLSDYRRTRLFTSSGSVPLSLWCFLIPGGILLTAFTWFFGHEDSLSQAAMTAALTGILTFSLFLILSLDTPYSGVARVTPQAFALELNHVAERMPK